MAFIEFFYNIASDLCFGFLTTRQVGSLLPEQGLNLYLLHWKVKSQLLDHQRSPKSTQF